MVQQQNTLPQRNYRLFNHSDEGKHDVNESNRKLEDDVRNAKYHIALIDFFQLVFTVLAALPRILLGITKRLFKKPKSVRGKVCLVTGAGRGLGRQLSLELAKLGAEVICVDIREDTNLETVKLIKEFGGKAHGYTCNVAKYQDVADLAETVQKEVGRVNLLVNNAALIMTHKAGEWPVEDVISMFNVNVLSNYWMIQSFLPSMKEVNEGHIVIIISLSSMLECPGLSVYGPTKAALDSLIRTLRLELNSNVNNNVKLTGIYPSIINTSDDIKNLYHQGNLRMLEMEEAVESIIEGIRYDFKFVIIPRYFNFLALFPRLFPEWLVLKMCQILNLCVNVPNEVEKDKIPFNEIRNKCL